RKPWHGPTPRRRPTLSGRSPSPRPPPRRRPGHDRLRGREAERQWRRHCVGPPARHERRPPNHDDAPRDGATRPPVRPRDALHRIRNGPRDDSRAADVAHREAIGGARTSFVKEENSERPRISVGGHQLVVSSITRSSTMKRSTAVTVRTTVFPEIPYVVRAPVDRNASVNHSAQAAALGLWIVN